MISDLVFMMNIAFATFAFDTILAKLSSQKLSSIRPGKYNGTSAPEIITNHLYKTSLPIVVEFGTAKLTMNDLLDMEVGDIIELENKINDEHKVKVSNRHLFYGRAGVVNKHKAIKITRKILQDENK